MFKLCNSKTEISSGIKAFAGGMRGNPDHPVYAQSGKYKCWYAIKDEKGEWIFGPSKFIGYAGMSVAAYMDHQPELDGKLTEKQLVKFSEEVDEEMHALLYDRLFDTLSRVNRTPGKSVKIKIIPVEKVAQTMSVKYKNTDKCDFYQLIDRNSQTLIDGISQPPELSSLSVAGDKVKFDLKYGDYSYIVELNKTTAEWLCEGKARRREDGQVIDCTALLVFDEGSVEIYGLRWFETGANYMWSAYAEEIQSE